MPVGQPPPQAPHTGVPSTHVAAPNVTQRLDASRRVFQQNLKMATQGPQPFGPSQQASFTREFAQLYAMPAALGVCAKDAQQHMAALQTIARGTPLEDLGAQAGRALGYLSKGAPPPPLHLPRQPQEQVAARTPLQPSVYTNVSPPSSARPPAVLQRREAMRGPVAAARSSRRATKAAVSRINDENMPTLPNPWESPVSEQVAQVANEVSGLSLRRDVPVLPRGIAPTDTLMTNASGKRDGEGYIFVVDKNGKQFRLQGMRYLQAQSVAMVESTRLGGGAFGDFSVGLLAQRNADPVLVAIKKMRIRVGLIGSHEIKTELALQQKICDSIAAHQAQAERELGRGDGAALHGVRSSFSPPKVYDAYFDDAKQQGFLLGSVADGDMQALADRILADRTGAMTPAVRESIVRSFIAQSGTQLDIMHKRVGVLHLDFKGANTLVDRTGQINLNDFGLSMSIGRGAQWEYETIGSMPVPEMFREVVGARPGLTPKTDAFCLALSGLDMLAADTGYILASSRNGPKGAPPQVRTELNARFLNDLQQYLRELPRGPDGQMQIPRTDEGRVDAQALPRLRDPRLTHVLNLCAQRHPELALSLFRGLHADPAQRSGVQQLAREAAASLPPIGSRQSRQVLRILGEAGTALAAQQPRVQLRTLGIILPRIGEEG